MSTPTDTTQIDAALESGVAEVATADGKKVKYRTPAELLQARAAIVGQAGTRPYRSRLMSISVRGE
jgi:hypothetical protein